MERLEARVNLASASLVPAAMTDPVDGAVPTVPAAVAVPSAPQVTELTTSSAAVVARFTATSGVWSAAVDVSVPALPEGTALRLRAAEGLTYWNGTQSAAFMAASSAVQVDLTVGGQTVAVRAGQVQPVGSRAVTLAAAATNHVAATIRVDGKPGVAAPAGWYAVPAKVVAANGGPSTPVTILFSIGTVPTGSRAVAIRAMGGVGAAPAAVSVGATLAAPVVPPPAARAPAPQPSPLAIVPVAAGGIIEVSSDIAVNTTFRSGAIYVITAEVHVRRGVTLTIEDGVEVRIRNGKGHWRLLTARALIFDSGSSLKAKNVVFRAANDVNEPVEEANNGGVFFCGGTRVATKDNVSSQNLKRPTIGWSFVADSITAHYLGRTDPRGGDGNGNLRDDIDAVSVIGAVFQEWKIKAVTVNHSGDDGFDLTNSSIAMDFVRVFAPIEDGVNMTTSLLQIRSLGRLEVDMTDSTARDREIFDFEVDTGATQIWIAPTAYVDIRGYWDNSPGDLRIDVKSLDMPRPSLLTREWYAFRGPLANGQALIFSIP